MASGESDNMVFYTLTIMILIFGSYIGIVNQAYGGVSMSADESTLEDGVNQLENKDASTVIGIATIIFRSYIWLGVENVPRFIEILFILPVRLLWAYLGYKALRGN